MKILLHGEADLTISDLMEPDFDIEVEDGVHAHFSAMQMFGASIGLCVLSVLSEYGERFGTDIDDATARVKWSYAEDPYRVSDIDLSVDWPGLPEQRIDAVQRAAKHCTIHNTLKHPPEMSTSVSPG